MVVTDPLGIEIYDTKFRPEGSETGNRYRPQAKFHVYRALSESSSRLGVGFAVR